MSHKALGSLIGLAFIVSIGSANAQDDGKNKARRRRVGQDEGPPGLTNREPPRASSSRGNLGIFL